MITVEIDMHSCSMRLINVEAFLQREQLFRQGKRVDRQAKVLEFGDDELTEYAILSHRWIEQEVDYNEIVKLAKMDEEERSEIRQRDGYRKIIQSCEQAKKDGYKWLWVDTCCIDKRSSAELSEAINSMYRWYENAKVSYAYLHDVSGPSFPTARNMERYLNSDGWPEWFSRGWTLQEMIAPRDVQFFNKDWYPIGDKRALSRTLQDITRVPQDVLKHGFFLSNRPCVAQIMSWAANRTTTRVEDRAYSLMGLLDVNMPMLYGEGKKAFHRLQLEIICTSNDQSIFAWNCNVRIGSILADDPSSFKDCNEMVLMNRDEFIEYLKLLIPAEELIEDDRHGTFPVTNRGIQIWLHDSDSDFHAVLPCRPDPSSPPLAIRVALWESNYYRYGNAVVATRAFEMWHPQLRQVYLRYQGTLHCSSTFEIDDSAVHKECVTRTYPEKTVTGNTVTLSTTDPLCLKHYSCGQQYHFEVAFGQCFDWHWIHVDCERFYCDTPTSYVQKLKRAPEHAQSMTEACSGVANYRVWVMETPLGPESMILQTSRVMWKGSRVCGVKLGVFRTPRLGVASGKWIGFDVDVSIFFCACTLLSHFSLLIQGTNDPDRDWRGLMIRQRKLRSHITETVRACYQFLVLLAKQNKCVLSNFF